MTILDVRQLRQASATRPPLLKTKFALPFKRRNLVARERLFQRLDAVSSHPITLLVAPAGYGKTTLLADWLQRYQQQAAQQQIQLAWLSLEAADNDLARFWAYFCALFGEHPASSAALPNEAALTELLNYIAELPHQLILVIDNFQHITDEAIQSLMRYVAEHLPAQLHLVVASRCLPSWPVARLRAHAVLELLGTAELRFIPAEAQHFLQLHAKGFSSGLQPEQIEQCEGWPVALALLAQGEHQPLRDFILQEIVAPLPADLHVFLLCTALLNRVSAGLAHTLMRRYSELIKQPLPNNLDSIGGVRHVLQRLAELGVPIAALDQGQEWFRYHSLFADALRSRLYQENPALLAKLHRSSAIWYEHQELPDEAVHHALACRDFPRAIGLIEQIAETMLWQRGDLVTLLRWLQLIPEKEFAGRPRLSLMRVWAWVMEGRLEAADGYMHSAAGLQIANTASDAPQHQLLQVELSAIRALLCAYRWGDPQQIEAYDEIVARGAGSKRFLRGTIELSAGIAYRRAGNVLAARQLLQRAVAILQDAGNVLQTLIALSNLSIVQIVEGRLTESMQTCMQAMQLVEAWGLQHSPVAGAVYMRLPFLLYEWNDLPAAIQAAENGISLARRSGNLEVMLHCYLGLGYIKQALGDTTGAQAVIQTMLQIAEHYANPRWLSQIRSFEVELWLMQGQLAPAEQWARWYAAQPHYDIEDLILVRFYLAKSRREPNSALLTSALALLDRMQRSAEQSQRMGFLIEVLVLRALLSNALGRSAEAVRLLQQSLAYAIPERFTRLFLNEGEPMALLLLRARESASPTLYAYIDYLLAGFPSIPQLAAPSPQDLLEIHSDDLLSAHEQAILRLLAAGRSNQEIGRERCLSVNTIKWHLKNIYGKLQVNSRDQAIMRAKSLHLV